MNVYPFIEAEKAGDRNVKRACELLQVSRATYYAQREGAPSARQAADAELTEQITVIHAESKGTYGIPRIRAELRRRGIRCGRSRIWRLMRRAGLRGRAARRWRRTTIPDPTAVTRADLIRRDFAADAAAINARWCGDITYINTWEGWLYLATVIDIASRRVVGWATADHLRTDLVARRCATPAPPGGHRPACCSTPTAAASTPAPPTRHSPTTSVWCCRSAAPDSAGTTPWPSRSSPPSKAS